MRHKDDSRDRAQIVCCTAVAVEKSEKTTLNVCEEVAAALTNEIAKGTFPDLVKPLADNKEVLDQIRLLAVEEKGKSLA